ncbi:DMT family transporter [Xanthobacteraceae bacterium A53D]
MVLAMAAFALEDACLKAAASSLPVSQVLLTFGACGILAFSVMALLAGERPLTRVMLSRVMVARSICEITARLFFMLAIALTPLSMASAILQATPLIVIASAALLFGEHVSVRRWVAVAVGLVGVILILRPGTEGFSLLSIFAVIATLGFAGRDLATRAAPRTLSHRQLGVLGFTSLLIAGAAALPFAGAFVVPSPGALLSLGCGSVAGITAYSALTAAMRTGEISAVTPFRYTRLVFAMFAGIVVFHERPDALTVAGAVVVVLAGLVALSPTRKARENP